MELLPQALLDGIMLGAIYIIIAIAFSLVFGVMHVIDFAVGEWIMLGAFTGFHLNLWTKVDPFLLLPVVFIVFAGLGYLIQPLHPAGALRAQGQPAAHGPGLHLRPVPDVPGPGPDPRSASTATPSPPTSPPGRSTSRRATSSSPSPRCAWPAWSTPAAITAALNYLLKHTDFGLGVRALAQHKEAAGLMGVNSRRTNELRLALYTGISAMTGVLIGTILSFPPRWDAEYSDLRVLRGGPGRDGLPGRSAGGGAAAGDHPVDVPGLPGPGLDPAGGVRSSLPDPAGVAHRPVPERVGVTPMTPLLKRDRRLHGRRRGVRGPAPGMPLARARHLRPADVTEALMWIGLALTFDVLAGYTGYLNFGHQAFFGIGAYTTALLMMKAALAVPPGAAGAGRWRRPSAPWSSACPPCACAAPTSPSPPGPWPGPSSSSPWSPAWTGGPDGMRLTAYLNPQYFFYVMLGGRRRRPSSSCGSCWSGPRSGSSSRRSARTRKAPRRWGSTPPGSRSRP